MITLNESQKSELNELFVNKQYVRAYKYIYRTFKDQMLAEQAYWFQQASEVGPSRKTPELLQYMEQISGVMNYVNQTFSLFSEVEKVRPNQ